MSDSTSATQNPVDYKATLNLPSTAFQMKAGATTREPELEAFWETNGIYEKAMAANKQHQRFLLHDGPPYLSSDKIHIGTAMNKILKDIVTRYKTQRGHYSPYVPGYDGHGLPIENAVVKSIKGGREAISPVELRKQCRAFAQKNLEGQTANFKRLGVWGDWDHPYITINAAFEALQIKLFHEMYRNGHVYKGLKPVYWCSSCETALADAEVEYADHTSHSVYVRFRAVGEPPAGLPDAVKARWQDTYFVIWTTTPWTLPANLALALNTDLDYVFVDTPQWGVLVVAEALLDAFIEQTGLEGTSVLGRMKGAELEHLKGQHPFLDRQVPSILGEHVTTEAGTGIVHTAPGHGMEDYVVGQRYGLGIVSPLNNKGVFTEEAGPRLAGVHYAKGSALVVEILTENNALIQHGKISHSYPHCWRCHNPVIYRATEQWFISMANVRQPALNEIKQVQWIPERGESRITSMVENRTDWCISRQRVWGVPIPVVYCTGCRKELINDTTIERIYEAFKAHSSDIWWEKSAGEILGADFKCPDCGGTDLEKEMDIMDVWFDSGVTHTAVVEARKDELGHHDPAHLDCPPLPVELYLEGSDQHRGWFQSALLTSVMLRGKAPYKSVLTHGFVLDENGRKMSKSLGNVVEPQQIIQQSGADVLRLWVASVDYTNDVRIGKEILAQLVEVYRKIRNTIRFILGNLAGFNAQQDRVAYDELSLLDKLTLDRLQSVVGTLTEAFDQYEFHKYYQVLQNFCVQDLSSLYFDVVKDVLYTSGKSSTKRRAVQTVLYEILAALTPMLVPVMPHMGEDIWLNIPAEHKPDFGMGTPPQSILLAPWPAVNPSYCLSPEMGLEAKRLRLLKTAVNESLEGPRSKGLIGSSLEAGVVLTAKNEAAKVFLSRVPTTDLTTTLIVSDVLLERPASAEALTDGEVPASIKAEEGEALELGILPIRALGRKCIRCWKFAPTVGDNGSHPEICAPCAEVVTALAV